MNLCRAERNNDAIEPWLQKNDWTFEINLDWTQFLIGGSYSKSGWGVLWTASIGPLIFVYYRNSNL